MGANIIIITTHGRIARAVRSTYGHWAVDISLEGQDVSCLACDPHNPQVVYAGTQGKGIWHSGDGGETWQPCGMSGQIVKSITVSPHDSKTLYAGIKPAYLYTSQDGGNTWEELPGFRRIPGRWWWFTPSERPSQAYVIGVAVSPDDPQVILAGIEFGGVVRSEDGGLSWSGHRKGALRDCHTIKFHATQKWVYQAGGTGGGAAYSQDGGITWRKAKRGLAKNYGVSCAADPGKPEVWYVSVAPGPSKAYGGQVEAYLYRAGSNGDWQSIGWEPHPMNGMPLALVTVPNAPGQLYAGLNNGDVWHTDDYGDNWQQLPFNLKGMSLSMVVI